MPTKHILIVLTISLLGLIVSCGHEDPTGTLCVVTDPSGAAVFIDGIASGDVTPAEIQRPVGRITVTATLDGFVTLPESRTLSVSAGRRVDAFFDLARLGTLTVTSSPSGGAIHIDGEDTGESTPHTFSLVEGTYTVEVVLDDHLLDGGPRDIDVSAAAPATEAFDLLPAGTLTVTSTHSGAAIFIDGDDTGEVTPHTFPLTAGTYRVHVTKYNFSVVPEYLDVAVATGAETVADFVTANISEYGGLMVRSTPPGASILLDGEATGEITPYEFSLPGGHYDVQVTRSGFFDSPVEQEFVMLQSGAGVDFTLTARKIVLLEYMSGVNCVGCPAMNTMLGNVEAAGYGPEKMLGLKYSGPFGGGDLHYDQNPTVLQNRMTVYANNTAWNWAAPTLFFDGDLPVEPNGYPAIGDLVTLLDAAHAVDPGFAIDVRVDDFSATDITVHVDLVATRDIVNANAVLNLAIVENPINYDTPQNDAGEDEFHWICREFVLGDASPLPIGPDTPASFDINVVRQGTWVGVPENLIAIAFVQDGQTLVVLQAGATDSGHKGELK